MSKDISMNIESLITLTQTLPQADVISPAHAERWASTVLNQDPDRAVWHVKRASGIGGSEIGALVADMRGDWSFKSAHDIVAEKLLIYPPSLPNGPMLRGIRMETVLREMFHKKFSAAPREDMIELMSEGSVGGDLSWMVGSPDDVVEIGGKIFIPDYKNPNAGAVSVYDRTGEVPFEYVAQLHQYSMIAAQKGIQVAGMFLVSLDWDKWEIDVRLVEVDQNLTSEILRAGDLYWNEYVMQKRLPERIQRPSFMPDPDLAAEIDLVTSEYLAADSLAKESKIRADLLRERVAYLASRVFLGDRKMSFGGVNISGKQVLDENAVANLLNRHGAKPDDFGVIGKLDADRAVGRLQELGEDISNFCDIEVDWNAAIAYLIEKNESVDGCFTEEKSVRLTSKKKGEEADYIAASKQRAGQVAEEFVSSSVEFKRALQLVRAKA